MTSSAFDWNLESGKRPDLKVIVQLTPRAANWIKTFDRDAKNHFNAKSLHSKASADSIAAACKNSAGNIDHDLQIGTAYKQNAFPGFMWPTTNRIEALPACVKAHLLDDTDELDMSTAQPTVMRWVCSYFNIPSYNNFTCDRKEFAMEDGIPEGLAKDHINHVWNSEHRRRGPKWEGFREF